MPSSYSVVVPAYNPDVERLLRTMTAIRKTLPDAEVIIVDDGSSEPLSRIELIYAIGARVIRHGDNRGPAAALNTGYRASTSRAVARCDVGDYWYPSAKQRQFDCFDSVDAGARLPCFSRAVDELSQTSWPHLRKRWLDDPIGQLAVDDVIAPSTTIVNRGAWEAHPFDETLRWGADWEWHVRIAKDLGWSFYSEVTGTTTCWPDGHSLGPDVDLERRYGDLATVSHRAREAFARR